MKHIHEILNMKPEKYEGELFKRYFHWCEQYANGTNEDFQKLLANSAVANWWRSEFSHFEDAFLEDVQPFIGTPAMNDTLKLRTLWSEHVWHIKHHWPKPILAEARKLQILNYESNN